MGGGKRRHGRRGCGVVQALGMWVGDMGGCEGNVCTIHMCISEFCTYCMAMWCVSIKHLYFLAQLPK
jgi:hypothetical protein